MPHRDRVRALAKTPIERIFQKVMHRKMTSQERIYFHLKRHVKSPPRGSANKNKHSRAA
jgi:hypothetical protein